MNRSSTSGSSDSAARTGIGRGLSAAREVLDELRSPSADRGDALPPRDDVRGMVLEVLAEQPSDGYRIVRTLEERGAGAPTPRAGAVYPTLQLLADEGLTTVAEVDGRKVHTLTTAGRAAAEAVRDRAWTDEGTATRTPDRRGGIARSAAQLAQAAALAAQTGTRQQVAETAAVLDEARRRIVAILARS
jgi:DNA-binding PadR family transcriptional regulator